MDVKQAWRGVMAPDVVRRQARPFRLGGSQGGGWGVDMDGGEKVLRWPKRGDGQGGGPGSGLAMLSTNQAICEHMGMGEEAYMLCA